MNDKGSCGTTCPVNLTNVERHVYCCCAFINSVDSSVLVHVELSNSKLVERSDCGQVQLQTTGTIVSDV